MTAPFSHTMRNRVAHGYFAEGSSQLGEKIAHLVGVREQHQPRLHPLDQLPQRPRIPIRRVLREQFVLHRVDPLQVLLRQFAGRTLAARHHRG